jgi:hypothetical protein
MADQQRRMTIVEAAAALGITPEVVRKRLQRGSLPGYKQDNRWIVLLPVQDPTHVESSNGHQDREQDTKPDTSRTEQDMAVSKLGERYESEITFLRHELATRTEELRRKDVLLAEFSQRFAEITQRLPELPATTPVATNDRTPDQANAEAGRPWWKFWAEG